MSRQLILLIGLFLLAPLSSIAQEDDAPTMEAVETEPAEPVEQPEVVADDPEPLEDNGGATEFSE